MPLDTVPTYPGQYDANEANNYPDGSETRKEGDDHLRRLKASEKATWTNVTGAVTATHGQLNLTASLSETEAIVQFESGVTKMQFYNDASPLGWTIDQTLDEHMVRLTNGSVAGGQAGGTSGGTNDFSAQFTTLNASAVAISVSQMPSHNHTMNAHAHTLLGKSGTGDSVFQANFRFASSTPGGEYMTNTGTNTNNTEGLASTTSTMQAKGGGATHDHTVDLRAKWAACIVATKD